MNRRDEKTHSALLCLQWLNGYTEDQEQTMKKRLQSLYGMRQQFKALAPSSPTLLSARPRCSSVKLIFRASAKALMPKSQLSRAAAPFQISPAFAPPGPMLLLSKARVARTLLAAIPSARA